MPRHTTPRRRPLMAKAKGTQVILREGEVLYIPSYWFHYIVSLDGSIQCNTRSGSSNRGRPDIKECGFY
jgi:ribosomal protein L16 Arg81 hydroxylase